MATMFESYTPGTSTFNHSNNAIQTDRWAQPQQSSGSSPHDYMKSTTQPLINLEHTNRLEDPSDFHNLQGSARKNTLPIFTASPGHPFKDELDRQSKDGVRNSAEMLRGDPLPVERNREDLESKWIHRDKLAQIESRELAEIGIQLGLTDRILSQGMTSPSAVPTTPERALYNSVLEDEHAQIDTQLPGAKRLRTTSGSLPIEEAGGDTNIVQAQMDRTSPEASSPLRIRKPGFSKIPIPKSSPATKATTNTQLEQPFHLARSGSIKNARDSVELLGNHKSRKSIASTVDSNFIDAPAEPGSPELQPSTPSTSRPTSISMSKKRSASDAKRLSRGGRAVSGQERPRNVSTPLKTRNVSTPIKSDTPRRPSTSNGPRQPINRPEGDAPWIATMFKPDPMLPQDQQILPTHAKRLAMEHGQFVPTLEPSEYITPSVPDSDKSTESLNTPKDANQSSEVIHQRVYAPHTVEQHFEAPQIVEQRNYDPPTAQPRSEGWPLKTSSSQDTDQYHQIPTPVEEDVPFDFTPAPTSVDDNAFTNDTFTKERQNEPPHAVTSPAPTTNAAYRQTRVPEAPINEKQDKACGCCIMM